jgi:guanine nucleotide-binding protein G(i) subunit alpha
MGGCASRSAVEAPTTPEKLRSMAIDRQIAEDERNFKKECKILLLGSGESGKSTIVKQMKIIHLHGYTPEELLSYRSVVNRNVVESAHALVLAMRKFGFDCQHSANRVRSLHISDTSSSTTHCDVAAMG